MIHIHELRKYVIHNEVSTKKKNAYSVNNVWCIKFRSKHSSNTVMYLLRNLMHHTLTIVQLKQISVWGRS